MSKKYRFIIRLLFIVSVIVSFAISCNVQAATGTGTKAKKKKCTVTFVDTVTHKVIAKKRVAKGKSVTPPKPKKHKKYHFKKWKGNMKKITKDTVIKAKYARVYTVRFYFQNQLLKKEQVEKGKNAHPPVLAPRDYIRFTGWNQSYKDVTESLDIFATYDMWPDWSNKAEMFAYSYGGLNNGNETFSGKTISMKPVENHSMGQTSIYLPAARAIFADYSKALAAGDETVSWSWMYHRAKDLPNDNYYELSNAIEIEYFGYICDPAYFHNMRCLDFSLNAYRNNLTYKAKIEAIARSLVKPGMTEREASAKFMEYISEKLTYSNAVHVRDSRAWYALSNGCGNCQAYSKLYKTMCNAVGIDCELVSGRAYSDGKWGGHLWNRVKIDGSWYYMDVTWADDDGWFDRDYAYAKTLWSSHKICSIYATAA